MWKNTCQGISNHDIEQLRLHDDVIKWKHFPRYWPFVRRIHRSPVNSPHKGQWRGALMFSLICVWINDFVNHREAGDLRRYHALFDVTVMAPSAPNFAKTKILPWQSVYYRVTNWRIYISQITILQYFRKEDCSVNIKLIFGRCRRSLAAVMTVIQAVQHILANTEIALMEKLTDEFWMTWPQVTRAFTGQP